jgi:dTDP-4-dehydrorhamnose 3,5-epimerase
MIVTKTSLSGALIVDLELRQDARGFFARTFCAREAEKHGINPTVVQCNVSFNHKAGTVRGLHFQLAPATETKLVRCTRGAILDVIVDVRPNSPTYLQHVAVELTADNRRALYVPGMFAHGYQALSDGAEVSYQTGEFYTPGHERGYRHDDPALGIVWPLPVTEISEKDRTWPLIERPGTAGAQGPGMRGGDR